jgi:hypothetical protein
MKHTQTVWTALSGDTTFPQPKLNSSFANWPTRALYHLLNPEPRQSSKPSIREPNRGPYVDQRKTCAALQGMLMRAYERGH